MAQNIITPAGSTSLILNGRSYTSFGEGDSIELTFPNNIAERNIGEGEVVNINERLDRNVAELTVRLMRKTDDDIAMSALANASPIVVIEGSFTENYIADNVEGIETYAITGGNIMKHPDKQINNQDGAPMIEFVIACFAKKSI